MQLQLESVSFTHVQYIVGDKLGKILAISSLFPIFIIVSYVTVIAHRRDLATMWMFLGQLLNEVFNYVLKRVIREERPTSLFLACFYVRSLGKGIWNAVQSFSVYGVFIRLFCFVLVLKVLVIDCLLLG
jgi:dolichyldiphosphatase